MSNNFSEKLTKLDIKIPALAKPAASYVPYVLQDKVIYASGQLPLVNGELLYKGLVKNDNDIETAQKAARACAVNLIAIINDATKGDLSKLEKILHLQILVASASDFNKQHLVANGASDLLVELFGSDVGSHSRAAYGVASLPLDATVEIAATFKLRD